MFSIAVLLLFNLPYFVGAYPSTANDVLNRLHELENDLKKVIGDYKDEAHNQLSSDAKNPEAELDGSKDLDDSEDAINIKNLLNDAADNPDNIDGMKKDYLDIEEQGSQFKEKIYVDATNRFEVIEVPAHNNLSEVKVFTDFKEGFEIYKLPSIKTCMVVKLKKDTERPETLLNVSENLHHHYPMEKSHDTWDRFIPNGDVDLKSNAGKIAKHFCGKGYNIQHAKVQSGKSLDDISIALEQEMGKAKRDVPLRDFLACSNQGTIDALIEQQLCNSRHDYLHASCQVKSRSCVYRVSCPFVAGKIVAWVCKGVHTHQQLKCCTYQCRPGDIAKLDVGSWTMFARDKYPQANQAFELCKSDKSKIKVQCTWGMKPNIPGAVYREVHRPCRYAPPKGQYYPVRFICDNVANNAPSSPDFKYCTYTCPGVAGKKDVQQMTNDVNQMYSDSKDVV